MVKTELNPCGEGSWLSVLQMTCTTRRNTRAADRMYVVKYLCYHIIGPIGEKSKEEDGGGALYRSYTEQKMMEEEAGELETKKPHSYAHPSCLLFQSSPILLSLVPCPSAHG